MDENSTDQNDISLENFSDRQNSLNHNQSLTNSIQNSVHSGRLLDAPIKDKKIPMTPTSLYIYFVLLSQYHSWINIFSLENIHGRKHIPLEQIQGYLPYTHVY